MTLYLGEGLGVVPDEWLAERSQHDALPKRVHHHIFFCEVQPHHLHSKTVEELLQRYSLILFYIKEVVRDWRGAQFATLHGHQGGSWTTPSLFLPKCSWTVCIAPHRRPQPASSVYGRPQGHLGPYECGRYHCIHNLCWERCWEFSKGRHRPLICTFTLCRVGLQVSAQLLVHGLRRYEISLDAFLICSWHDHFLLKGSHHLHNLLQGEALTLVCCSRSLPRTSHLLDLPGSC